MFSMNEKNFMKKKVIKRIKISLIQQNNFQIIFYLQLFSQKFNKQTIK